jgi:O-antigen ligase
VREHRFGRIRDKIGLWGLLIFAFFAWLGTTVAHLALLGLALTLFAEGPAAWTVLQRDPFVRLHAVFLVYLLAAASWASLQRPESAHEQWAAVWPWISLWSFFVLAWWLKGRWDRVCAVMILAPLGFLCAIIRRSDWHRLPLWVAGERYEFGFTALGLSFLAVVIILGSLTFLPRIAFLAKGKAYGPPLILLSLGVQLFFLFVLMVAQSRGAWLSLIFGLLLLVLFSVLSRETRPANEALRAHSLTLPILVSVALILAASVFFRDAVVARFTSETNAFPELLSLDIDKLPYSAGWSRIHLAYWGGRMFSEHPLLGWGPGTNATLYLANRFADAQGGFPSVIRQFSHLHNVYLETLVRFGVLGSVIFLGGFIIFARSMSDAHGSGIIPTDFFVFSKVILLTTLFLGCYEFRLLHTDFRFFALLFGGIVYTFALHGNRDLRGRRFE